MRAVAVTGFKKSGKTTLCVNLGHALSRMDVRAAAVKCTHHPNLDLPATDTARLAEAYPVTAAVAPAQSAIFWGRRRYIPDLTPMLDADFLVVEGGKELGWLPRVLVLRAPEEAEELDRGLALCTFGEVKAPGVPHVTSMDELAALVLERGFALPGLDCSTCGRDDCAALAREIVAGTASPKDCLASRSEVRCSVNGVPLAMNPFSERVLAGVIQGVLRELKGFAPGEVEISFTCDSR
jgi:molybdopterin-guanine dinucleotide biosynthesis adapter protein